MPSALVTCDDEAHLRALACKLLADKVAFSVYPSNLSVRFEKDESDPGYAHRVLNETASGEVHFDFDSEEKKGRLSVRPASTYGVALAVNGVEWGFLDLFDAASGNRGQEQYVLPPQLLFFSPHNDNEQWLKVVVDPDDRMSVVIHKEAGRRGDHPRPIHSDRTDVVYTAPWEPAEAVR